MDSSALRFLTASALEAVRKLEEEEKAKVKKLKEDMEATEHEEKMLELNRRFQADLPLSAAERGGFAAVDAHRSRLLSVLSWDTRKKRKKRKRRLPRTSSRPSRGRARRRQRQWHVSGSPGDVFLRAAFPSVVVRPEMPCIMASLDLKDRCSGLFKAGIAGDSEPRAVFLPFRQAQDAPHHGRHAPEGQLPEAYRKLNFLRDNVVLF